MTGHTIVCGFGHVGYRVVRLLVRLGEPVTVITLETKEEWLRWAEAAGVRIITGDARDEHILGAAGLETARALIAVTDHDMVNIEAALDARAWRPDLPIVLRVFDPALGEAMEKAYATIRRAVGTSALAAPVFAASAMGDDVLSEFTVGEGDRRATWIVGRLIGCDGKTAPDDVYVLHDDGSHRVMCREKTWFRLTGSQTPEERRLEARQAARRRALNPVHWYRATAGAWKLTSPSLRVALVGILLLTLVSVYVFERALHLALGDAVYYALATMASSFGDLGLNNAAIALKLFGAGMMLLGMAATTILFTIITDYVVTARFAQHFRGRRGPLSRHVVVAGLGNVGYRVVEELLDAGYEVVAIELNAASPAIHSIRNRAPVVIGDARQQDVLQSAWLETAAAVIAATDNDAANLSIALAARRMAPDIRTVTRVFDDGFAEKVETSLGVNAAHSTSAVAAPTFVAASLFEGVRTAFVVEDRLYTVVWRKAGEDWSGRSPHEVIDGRRVVAVRDFSDGRASGDRLTADDDVLAVLCRDLQPEATPRPADQTSPGPAAQ